MRIALCAILALAAVKAPVTAADGPCAARQHAGADYVVCRFSADDDIRLFLNDANGEPWRHFNFLREALEEKGETLIFAMNAGMYHGDRSPVGLYIEDHEQSAPLNANDGPGNFHMKPNGVFLIQTEDGFRGAHVITSAAYREGTASNVVAYATQSGPMLVIDGDIHPRFLPQSTSLKRRNGVGVTEAGDIFFALADSPVRLFDFATFFRDELKTPNALYLDGTISRVYAPALERYDPGFAMGPMLGVVKPND